MIAEPSVSVNIADKVQNETQASVLSEVTISRVEYAVSANTLNFDTPKALVFVGPNSAESPSDASVVQFAEIDPITQGTTFDTAIPADERGRTAAPCRVGQRLQDPVSSIRADEEQIRWWSGVS